MTKMVVDCGARGAALDIGRFCSIGQCGWTHRPIPAEQVEPLRNLNMKFIRLFVQEYYHVCPRRGVYDWDLLDRSIERILDCGAKPVMCICFKPRALFPAVDQTIVHPNSYEAWEKLIREMVRHCNSEKRYGIEYWEVANEPDIGGGGGCPYLFTPESYPVYYEHTARAIRAADPRAKVGGPAIARSFSMPPCAAHPQGVAASPILPAFLEYAAQKNLPLDFVSWHRYSDDPEEFRKSCVYVRGLLEKNGLACETSINEWNIGLRGNMMMHLARPEYQPCFVIDVINVMINEGVSHGCYWHIRGVNLTMGELDFLGEKEKGIVYSANYNSNLLAVFDAAGNARPVYYAFHLLSRLTGRRVKVDGAGGKAKALAAYDADQDSLNILVWNFATKQCRREKVSLKIKVKPGVYTLCEYRLDAGTAAHTEDERLKVVRWVDFTPETAEFNETLELAPYGVAMLRFKFRGPSSAAAPPVPQPDLNNVTAEDTPASRAPAGRRTSRRGIAHGKRRGGS